MKFVWHIPLLATLNMSILQTATKHAIKLNTLVHFQVIEFEIFQFSIIQ